MLLLISAITLINAKTIVDTKSCLWTDDDGHSYDLGKLDKPDGWQIKDEESGMGMFSMVYIFNFCDFQKIRCHERQVAVYEALSVMGQLTENCDVVGSLETQKISHVDPSDHSQGIQINYGLGDLCMNQDVMLPPSVQGGGPMEPREAVFTIKCAADGRDDEEFTIVQGRDQCIDQFLIRHHVGCPPGTFSGWSFYRMIKWTIIIFMIYMTLGLAYNRKVKQIEGAEAIPHLALWQRLGPIILEKLHELFIRIQVTINKLRGREGYDTV